MDTDEALNPTLVAYEVNIYDMRCIVFASTNAKARYKAVRAYREAGYGNRRTWPHATAARRPYLDDRVRHLTDLDRAYTEASL